MAFGQGQNLSGFITPDTLLATSELCVNNTYMVIGPGVCHAKTVFTSPSFNVLLRSLTEGLKIVIPALAADRISCDTLSST